MSEIDESAIYDTIGEEGFARLTHSFYQRVSADSILRPMYPENEFPAAEQRLRDFLVFRFGGPQRYIQERGHPRLRMRHAPFPIDQAARDRWIELMDEALLESQIPEACREKMKAFFDHAATFMINQLET